MHAANYLWELRHSFTSRLLFTCISSRLFNGEQTLRDLNSEWAKQLRSLFYDGVEVGCNMCYYSHVCVWVPTFFTSHPNQQTPGGWQEAALHLDCHQRRLAIFKESTLAKLLPIRTHSARGVTSFSKCPRHVPYRRDSATSEFAIYAMARRPLGWDSVLCNTTISSLQDLHPLSAGMVEVWFWSTLEVACKPAWS